MNKGIDQILWKKIQTGDAQAFEELYRLYAKDLIVFGKSITSNTELIKETLQKLFIYIWEKRSSLELPNHVKAYLVRSFRNNLLREIKRETKLEGINIDELLEEIPGVATTNPFDVFENIDRLRKMIDQLPDRQKEIINLRYYQGIKHQEIAEILDINYQSVSNLLTRAIRQLRSLWQKSEKNI